MVSRFGDGDSGEDEIHMHTQNFGSAQHKGSE